MALEIVRAKVQAIYLSRKEKATRKVGPDKGKAMESKRRFRVILGAYIEFNDGWTVMGPDGRLHRGRGTVVRFSNRHRTWSVQRPQRCETNRVGYVFTLRGEPCWLKAERESGFTLSEFERSFSPGFVKLCLDGHALAKNQARQSASIRRAA